MEGVIEENKFIFPKSVSEEKGKLKTAMSKNKSPVNPRVDSLKNEENPFKYPAANGGNGGQNDTLLNRSSSLYSHSLDLMNIRKEGFLFGPTPNSHLGPRALLSGIQCTEDVANIFIVREMRVQKNRIISFVECEVRKTMLISGLDQVRGMMDPSLQCLEWQSKPRNVLVVKKIYDREASHESKKIIQWMIEEKGMTVISEMRDLNEEDFTLDEDFSAKYLPKIQPLIDANGKRKPVDLIVCLGGDGTLLHVSSLFQACCPPVISFHLGSMGFLAPFSVDDFRSNINSVLSADVGLQLRSRLKCQVRHSTPQTPRGTSENTTIEYEYLVMNEVVIERGSSSVTNVEIHCNGRLITTLLGDGLIISTPTGSTAYSAAAGASMVHPSVPGIVLTPICPHSLSFRPIVLPAGVELKILVPKGSRVTNQPRVSFDGRYPHNLSQNTFLRVTTSVYPVPCISHHDHLVDWFDSLAACLHWNRRETKRSHRKSPDAETYNGDK